MAEGRAMPEHVSTVHRDEEMTWMAYTLDSSEPQWWLDGMALPDNWTVEGTLLLRSDEEWVAITFEQNCPASVLRAAVQQGGQI